MTQDQTIGNRKRDKRSHDYRNWAKYNEQASKDQGGTDENATNEATIIGIGKEIAIIMHGVFGGTGESSRNELILDVS